MPIGALTAALWDGPGVQEGSRTVIASHALQNLPDRLNRKSQIENARTEGVVDFLLVDDTVLVLVADEYQSGTPIKLAPLLHSASMVFIDDEKR